MLLAEEETIWHVGTEGKIRKEGRELEGNQGDRVLVLRHLHHDPRELELKREKERREKAGSAA